MLSFFHIPFWSTVLQCGALLQIQSINSGRCSQRCQFFYTAHRQSVAVICMLYKIRCNPMPPSSWCSTRAVCACAGNTRFFGRTSVHLCASTLQNLVVPQDFCSPISIYVERSW